MEDRAAIQQLARETGAQVDVKSIRLLYDSGILGMANVQFVDRKRAVDGQLEVSCLASPEAHIEGINWDGAERLSKLSRRFATGVASVDSSFGPFFAPVPESASSPKRLSAASKDFADWLYMNVRLPVTVSTELNLAQDPDEDERAFKIRLQQAAHERRDDEVEKLQKSYATKIDRLTDKLDREQKELAKDQAKAQAKQSEQWINIGESILGVFMGRRSSRALSSAASKWNQASAAAAALEESKATIAALEVDIKALEAELQAQVDEITARWTGVLENLTTEELAPRRTDVNVQSVTLAWMPTWQIEYELASQPRVTTLPAYHLPEVG